MPRTGASGSSTSRWFAALGALLAAAVPLLVHQDRERALTGLLGLLSGLTLPLVVEGVAEGKRRASHDVGASSHSSVSSAHM